MTPDHFHDALRQLAAEALPVRIAGACMRPHVQDGARVWVRAARRYWPGDVVVIHAWDGRWLVHRVIGGYWRGLEWRWLTQGDRASRPDAAVPADRILGKVCGGDCGVRLVKIPARDRLWALGRYARFALSRWWSR